MNSMTYVLYNRNIRKCILIDCGEWSTLSPFLIDNNLKVEAVFLTHGHSDHIYGLKGLLMKYPDTKIYTTVFGHEELGDPRKNLSYYHEAAFTIDEYNSEILKGGEILHFQNLPDVQVIACPGHDPSCLSYCVGNALFTGDAYIPGVKVFTKFPRGNKHKAMESYEMLKQMETDGYEVYCGHHDFENFVR